MQHIKLSFPVAIAISLFAAPTIAKAGTEDSNLVRDIFGEVVDRTIIAGILIGENEIAIATGKLSFMCCISLRSKPFYEFGSWSRTSHRGAIALSNLISTKQLCRRRYPHPCTR